MTIRDDRDQSTILLHLPPRIAGGDERGAVRIAPGVAGQTDAIASYDDRVWLALAPERGPASSMIRRIVTLAAVRSVGGAWGYPPGRPEVLAPLPGRDEVIGFVGTVRGPVVLTRSRVDNAQPPTVPEWNLQILSGSSWHTLPLPWSTLADAPPPGSTVRLASLGDSLALLVFPAEAGPWTDFRAMLPDAQPAATTGAQTLAWTRALRPLEGLNMDSASGFSPDVVYAVGDGSTQQLVAARWLTGGEVEVVSLRNASIALLATIDGVPRDHRLAPLNSTDSLAILWWEAGAANDAKEPVSGSTAARKFTIAEVSTISGKVLYRGEHKGGGIISGGEFKLLAIALLLVTTLVLLFALRAEPSAVLALPKGFTLADPLRRIIAAVVDLVPGVVIAAFSLGIEPESMLSPAILLGPRAEWLAWPLALGLTIFHCTLGEALSGRSIGKAISGCEVASLVRDRETGKIDLQPVAAWQALVRNVIRWGIPVLGIILLIDGGRRHPADAAARTVVVTRVEDSEGE